VPGGYNLKQILEQIGENARKPVSKTPAFFKEYLVNDAL